MTSALALWMCPTMYELPALNFIGAVTEVRRLATVLDQGKIGPETFDDMPTRERVAVTITEMRDHLAAIGDPSSYAAADRLQGQLRDPEMTLTYDRVREQLRDIESRFSDHLKLIRLFVLRSDQLSLLRPAAELLEQPTALYFSSVWYDCEEAAKCILTLRSTASVFHSMRMLEVGIKAFAARLGIPDPVKPAERNWGVILRTIKNKIDATYSAEQRMPGSEGAFMEGLFATLDAVKNPWRNETMHVEGVYTDAEARYILLNVITFLQKMATDFDENGDRVDPNLLPD